jgi:hypothetical protein
MMEGSATSEATPRGDNDEDVAAVVVVVDGDTAPLPTATAAAALLDLLEPHPMFEPLRDPRMEI